MSRGEQEFSLRWNNYENNLCVVLESMLKRGVLVDVTLSCEGKSLRVHRAILSACSPYFEDLFIETEHSHPIVILKDVKAEELQALIDYMYTGQVTVSQSKLASFLKTAESLKIRGLANAEQYQEETVMNPESCIPLRKRKRNFSAEVNQSNEESKELQIRSGDGPTDLSLPKPDSEICFQPVIQAISYSAVDPTNANQPSKIYLKPKEALISPPPSEMSEGSLERSIHEQDGFGPTNADGFHHSNMRQDQNNMTYDDGGNESSQLYNSQSDDEDNEHAIQESEVGTPMVRSGVCTVCGCFRSDLRQHMESHSGQSFQCHLCGRAYPRRKTLNQHIKRSHQVYTRSAQQTDSQMMDNHDEDHL